MAAPSSNFVHNFTQNSQYSEDVIKSFESTFGKSYMSAGGHETSLETARLLAPVLDSNPRPVILDIGCGIGGSAFFFATEYGATVHGVDINSIGIDLANKELQANPVAKGKCIFQTIDVTSDDCHYDEGTFDVIHSRDVILHLDHKQKMKLFTKFQTWLKPGGMVIICDYCLGPKSAVKISDDFQKYMDTRGYHLLTPQDYKQAFVDSGFEADFVNAQDQQLWYCQMARKEIDRVLLPGPNRDLFLEQKTQADLEKLAKVYDDKITMTLRGDRSYVMVTATKTPSNYSLRKEVVEAYKTVSKKNYIMSCDGNVSCRASADTFMITPSGVTIPDLTPDKVVLCNMDGKAVQGEKYKPSSESALHNCIYKERPDVGAIVHIHSIYACALACCRLPLPPAHYAVCELLQNVDFSNPAGGTTGKPISLDDLTVKCAPYHTYGSKALAEATMKGLGKNHAVIMANHGAIVVGENMEMAMYNADRLERECEIYWRCLQMQMVGPPKPLTMSEIRDLKKADETYGQNHPDEDLEEEFSDHYSQGIEKQGGVPEAVSLSDTLSDDSSSSQEDEESATNEDQIISATA
jgi:L-ribulose-5-phosphate 4-epimerase